MCRHHCGRENDLITKLSPGSIPKEELVATVCTWWSFPSGARAARLSSQRCRAHEETHTVVAGITEEAAIHSKRRALLSARLCYNVNTINSLEEAHQVDAQTNTNWTTLGLFNDGDALRINSDLWRTTLDLGGSGAWESTTQSSTKYCKRCRSSELLNTRYFESQKA